MEFIRKNLKLIGVLISLLIIIDIVIEGKDLLSDANVTTKIVTMLIIIGLTFALLYIAYGYNIESARCYKLFMYSYSILSIYDSFYSMYFSFVPSFNITNFLIAVVKLVTLYCVISLTIGKDLGKEKSYSLCIINFIVTVITFVLKAITNTGLYFGFIILSISTIVFIIGKYEDKKSRGRNS